MGPIGPLVVAQFPEKAFKGTKKNKSGPFASSHNFPRRLLSLLKKERKSIERQGKRNPVRNHAISLGTCPSPSVQTYEKLSYTLLSERSLAP